MSDKIKQVANSVKLIGKIAEFEYSTGETKEEKIPYVSIKGAIQFGDTKAQTRRFERYVQERSKSKDGKEGKENKLYESTLKFAKSVKSLASIKNDEEPTVVEIQGTIATNDYVNEKDELIESLKVDAVFFNDVDGNAEFKGVLDLEGYIQSIAEETKGEDKNETGRLRVTLVTMDFFGNAIPVKNIIVPNDLKEAFEENYEVGQTAKFYIDYVVNKAPEKPKKTGGLGQQRTTDGKTYIEMILTGADPALDEDDEGAISKEAIRIALTERKNKLNELKEAGYQGKKSSGSVSRTGISSSNKKPKPASDEDIPF